ncbi:MAG TPA: UbiA-like polyprenyltransferase [Bryobacteraceae bacterium]|jgi:4-hydroxybenzoate polyprenyltransferase|nr:UbiA-like polyprenyltransferase [Bryobacteraceae bacterium]
MKRFWTRLRLSLEMIKFEHSIFALPFALIGALLAWRDAGSGISDFGRRLIWIVVAMVSARSAAMAFNRILDAQIDGRNRRTAARHLPAGLLSIRFAWFFTAAASLVLFMAAYELGFVCLVLAPLALGLLFFYSYCKRFTLFSHIVLGFCLGIAPAAAWIAVRGVLDPRILWLTGAVMFWTAGFDVIYACQDYEFDVAEGLFSIPRRVGVARALWIARFLHAAMVCCLLMLVAAFHLGLLSFGGVAAVVALLVYEHGLVKPHDLSRVNAAFFTVNGYVSLLFFAFWAADILLHRPAAMRLQ